MDPAPPGPMPGAIPPGLPGEEGVFQAVEESDVEDDQDVVWNLLTAADDQPAGGCVTVRDSVKNDQSGSTSTWSWLTATADQQTTGASVSAVGGQSGSASAWSWLTSADDRPGVVASGGVATDQSSTWDWLSAASAAVYELASYLTEDEPAPKPTASTIAVSEASRALASTKLFVSHVDWPVHLPPFVSYGAMAPPASTTTTRPTPPSQPLFVSHVDWSARVQPFVSYGNLPRSAAARTVHIFRPPPAHLIAMIRPTLPSQPLFVSHADGTMCAPFFVSYGAWMRGWLGSKETSADATTMTDESHTSDEAASAVYEPRLTLKDLECFVQRLEVKARMETAPAIDGSVQGMPGPEAVAELTGLLCRLEQLASSVR